MNHFKMILVLTIFLAIVSFTPKNTESSKNEWQTLFNDKNLDGWIVKFHHHDLGDNYANTFRVKDGKPLTAGYIGLQAEGQGIEFREIKIKNLE